MIKKYDQMGGLGHYDYQLGLHMGISILMQQIISRFWSLHHENQNEHNEVLVEKNVNDVPLTI
jgi:hypothetical protein